MEPIIYHAVGYFCCSVFLNAAGAYLLISLITYISYTVQIFEYGTCLM